MGSRHCTYPDTALKMKKLEPRPRRSNCPPCAPQTSPATGSRYPRTRNYPTLFWMSVQGHLTPCAPKISSFFSTRDRLGRLDRTLSPDRTIAQSLLNLLHLTPQGPAAGTSGPTSLALYHPVVAPAHCSFRTRTVLLDCRQSTTTQALSISSSMPKHGGIPELAQGQRRVASRSMEMIPVEGGLGEKKGGRGNTRPFRAS